MSCHFLKITFFHYIISFQDIMFIFDSYIFRDLGWTGGKVM